MRVYLAPPKVASPSLMRVTDALVQHKPEWVEIVPAEDLADIVVLHVIGRQDQTIKQVWQLNCKDKDYAVIQYAIRSTLRPETEGWLPLWRHAKVTWSYYDLPELVAEDGITGNAANFDFYHAPLGVDEVFTQSLNYDKRIFQILTSGQSYLTESVRECLLAARAVGTDIYHLGDNLKMKNAWCGTGLTDRELAGIYSQCKYVSGLRRVEGFELPAAEGLMCGARPIMFDRPHYRKWFNDWAIFIPESPREETIEHLRNVFSSPYNGVTQDEIAAARQLFNWERIIKNFWERLFS